MRAAHSLGQGALIVGFRVVPQGIGLVGVGDRALFTAGLPVDATLVTPSGPLSDRFGRKRFLL